MNMHQYNVYNQDGRYEDTMSLSDSDADLYRSNGYIVLGTL